MNLSNSGLGFSGGLKGFRVGVDGKGRAYIGGGSGILRFREYIGNDCIESLEDITIDDFIEFYNCLWIFKPLACLLTILLSLYIIGSLIKGYWVFALVCIAIAYCSIYQAFYVDHYKFAKMIKVGLDAFYEKDDNTALYNFLAALEHFEKDLEIKIKLSMLVINIYSRQGYYDKAIEFIKYLKLDEDKKVGEDIRKMIVSLENMKENN